MIINRIKLAKKNLQVKYSINYMRDIPEGMYFLGSFSTLDEKGDLPMPLWYKDPKGNCHRLDYLRDCILVDNDDLADLFDSYYEYAGFIQSNADLKVYFYHPVVVNFHLTSL